MSTHELQKGNSLLCQVLFQLVSLTKCVSSNQLRYLEMTLLGLLEATHLGPLEKGILMTHSTLPALLQIVYRTHQLMATLHHLHNLNLFIFTFEFMATHELQKGNSQLRQVLFQSDTVGVANKLQMCFLLDLPMKDKLPFSPTMVIVMANQSSAHVPCSQ